MSYVVRDPLGPAFGIYANNKRFRNRILKYWPTKVVDGVRVFAPLVVWVKNVGVLQDANRIKIYKLLGMTVKDLEANDYTGLDRAYLQVPAVESDFNLTNEEIAQYLQDNSPQIYPNNPNIFSSDPETPTSENYNPDPYQFNPTYPDIVDDEGNLPEGALPEPQWDKYGWITDYVIYQPDQIVDKLYVDKATDSQIIDFVKAGDSKYVSINGLKYTSPIFFAALKDTNNVLYEKKYTIIKKELTKKTTITKNLLHNQTHLTESLITTKAVIKVEYRRVKEISDSSVQGLINSIRLSLASLSDPDYNDTSTGNQVIDKILSKLNNNSNTAKQMKTMYFKVKGYSSSEVNYGSHVRYDALSTLSAKNFTKIFVTLVDFEYDETPATFWEKATSVLITVVTFIVVAVLIYTQEYWAIPLVLSAGALGQGALAKYWEGQGKYAAASYAGRQAQYLANMAEVSGYLVSIEAEAWLALVLMGIAKILEQTNASGDLVIAFKVLSIVVLALNGKAGAKEASKAASKEAVKEVTAEAVKEITAETVEEIEESVIEQVVDSVVDSIQSLNIATALNKFSVNDWLGILNASFDYYTNYMNPPAKMDDMAQKIEAQNKQLEALDGPETVDTVERKFSDPYDNYIDGNARMQRVPQDMTYGLNANLMNKYYNSGY